MRIGLILLFIILGVGNGFGQNTCTTPGQNPSTAFPVCGTSVFTQNSVPLCGGKVVKAPGCNSNILTDINPFWYKFTCFQAGTLGFKIKPQTNSEDYDWQLFDITGRNPNEVYTDPGITVTCNWSGEGGETGASSAGNNLYVCEGTGQPLWSKMANLIQGHDYLLLVSHFTQTQSGYTLTFGGGNAVITDVTPPHVRFAEADCSGSAIRVKLNKKMKCSSIAANGSDFILSPATALVIGAKGIGCSAGFDTDSVELVLSTQLNQGTYSLVTKNGTDGNTIIDNCGVPIPVNELSSFTLLPLVPTPMDSLTKPSCAAKTLNLVFRKPILCASVAPDGSDFRVTGQSAVSVISASGNCAAGSDVSRSITITLGQPMADAGNYSVVLKTGTDGNTLLDECSQQTPAGSSLPFTMKDTVNADFNYQKFYGCLSDTVNFFHSGFNGITQWIWDLGDGRTSSLQNPQAIYQQFTDKSIQLIVGNGFCSDTSSQKVSLTNFIKAGFSVFEDNCPNENIEFKDESQGQIKSYSWTFGDGGSSSLRSPAHVYSGPLTTTPFSVKLIVRDSLGCESATQKTVRIYSSCYLAVPTGFTPNNDGLNDYLAPLNAIKADNLRFRVFNRWGQLVFETRNWKTGWDGRYKGLLQSPDVYVWFLTYIDRDSKALRQMKGTALLIR